MTRQGGKGWRRHTPAGYDRAQREYRASKKDCFYCGACPRGFATREQRDAHLTRNPLHRISH